MDGAALWNYLLVLGTLLAAGLGLPIPEELPIIGAGIAVGHNTVGHPYWYIMLPVCIVGVVVGDGFLYTIGRLWGYRLLKMRWVRKRLLTADKQERIERNFHRYGFWILLGARLLPGIRSPIFIMAGINRLPLIKFLTADLVYAIPGVSMLFFLAYEFTDAVMDLFKKVQEVRSTIIVALIAGAVGYLIRYFQEHPVSTGDPGELPVIGQQIISHMKEIKEDEGGGTPSSSPATNAGHSPSAPLAGSSPSANGTAEPRPRSTAESSNSPLDPNKPTENADRPAEDE